MEEIGLAAMLAAKRLAGVAPEMESQGTCMAPSNMNKTVCSVFEISPEI